MTIRTALLLLLLTPAVAQLPVRIQVDAAHPTAPYKPIWNNFGADEPNYTYTPNGTQLLRELSQIDPATPVTFRPHNLLTSGDGSASLKWGSTNVYTESPDGAPIYNWTLTDTLFDNLQRTHIRPLVEIGFMPESLSTHPTPYRHTFPQGEIFTGWSYPPRDYSRWRALIVAWVEHLHQRYGAAVDTWQWEVWNEPDIAYFHGSPQEYTRLYDITTAAVRQVLPHALVGGPAVTGPGPGNPFLRTFLDHCAHGLNADTGKPGVPLDFISFHPKGSPKFQPETPTQPAHVRMNLARQLEATDRGLAIVASFPQYRNTPILLTETDPEGCAACKGPQNGYRNGTLYGVSVAEMLARSAELARLRGVNLQAAVTWAFEFEDQPPFAGFRELATSGSYGLIDKPVLNVFRLFSRLSGSLLPLTSSASLTAPQIIQTGVTSAPDIGGLATLQGHTLSILLWNYHDEDLPAPPTPVTLDLNGLPAKPLHIVQYRVDQDHANAYTAWLKMGSPQQPTPAQVVALQQAASLQTVEHTTQTAHSTQTSTPANPVHLSTTLPRQAVALYQITW